VLNAYVERVLKNLRSNCWVRQFRHVSLLKGERIEVGLREFLSVGNFKVLTTTFDDLYGLAQLPVLAVQRLMRDGYGFGAEGDWKTSALVRAMKVMSADVKGGVSFMEDYTYHFTGNGDKVLGAHMLEICESIASHKPKLDILPLSIGGKADPLRLILDANLGQAIGASIIDLASASASSPTWWIWSCPMRRCPGCQWRGRYGSCVPA
jgi:L-arabinose isomerase